MTEFPAGRWRARWIWAGGAPSGRHSVGLHRVVELDRVPPAVPARWCAVSRCILVVNGIEVGRGPVRSNPRSQPPDDADLAPYLRPGTNVFAVVATCYSEATPWYLPVPSFANDLVGGAFVLEALFDGGWLVTDGAWAASVLDGWGADGSGGVSGRGREMLTAAALPAGWETSSSITWPAAVERRAHTTGETGRAEPPSYPIGPFGARPISWPAITERALHPSGSSWTAAEIVAGTVAVDVEGPAGAVVVVRPAEFLDADGRPCPTEHDASMEFHLDGTGRRMLESFDSYGMHGALVEAPAGVVVHSVAVRERLYPVTGDASFECSDRRLEAIWAVGRRTVTLNSTDAYTDCPTREQRAWTGDAVVHQLVDLTTNFDWRLARRHCRLAGVPRPDGMLPMAVAGDAEQADFTIIPDWALHWVHSVWNLYRYVGDRAEIAELLQVAEGVVRWFERFCDPDGLPADVYGWVIIDWSAVHTEGVSTALCGLWGRALLEVAEMAAWLGDTGRARWAQGVHARLERATERMWDPVRELYVDSMVAGEQQPMTSQHAQAAAMVGRLAPRDRWSRLVEVLTDSTHHVHATFSVNGPAGPGSETPVGGKYLREGHPTPWWDITSQVVVAQPFFRYVVHDALVDAGRADLIAGLCLDWEAALARCPTSWTETWFGGTVSHGWSSTPTRDLVQRVLGVTPAEPGFAAANIEPALGYLDWARGSVPTPVGPLRISVDRSAIEVDSPVPLVHAGHTLPAGEHRVPIR